MNPPSSRTSIAFAGRRITCHTVHLPDGPRIQPTPRQIRAIAATGRAEVRCLGLASDDARIDADRDNDRHDWRPVDPIALDAGDPFRAPAFEAMLLGHRRFRNPATLDPESRIIRIPQQAYAGPGWELREVPSSAQDPIR